MKSTIPASVSKTMTMRTAIAATAMLFLHMPLAPAQPAPSPAARVETIARPIPTSRLWTLTVAPDAAGHPCFIGMFMNYKGTTEFHFVTKPLEDGRQFVEFADPAARPNAEWGIADLETGAVTVQELPGFHAGAFCRAGNGRVFFTVDFAHIVYFDPTAKRIVMLGQIFQWQPFTNERGFFRMQLGPDGMVYATTQSYNKTTSLARIDPDTLEVATWRHIGTGTKAENLTYGYYMEVVPPWIYVAVGQDAWELVAVNTETGEQRLLAERSGTGARIFVAAGPLAPRIELIGTEGRQWLGRDRAETTPGGQQKQHLLAADGFLFPAAAAAGEELPFVPLAQRQFTHVAWKHTQPLPAGPMPTVDPKSLSVDPDGTARIAWAPAGQPDAIRELSFPLNHAESAPIESLIALPDGTLLGNTTSYQGFFRCDPKSGKTEVFRNHGPSRVKPVVIGGTVYFAGYPNMQLWGYDPQKPWTSTNDPHNPGRQTGNPALLAYFGQGVSEAHYCNLIADGGNGRVYLAGKRERWAVGTGLGTYDIASGTAVGLREALSDVHPEGLAVLPELGRVVFAGKRLEERPDAPAELIVFDLDLQETARLPLSPELKSGGRLLSVGNGAAVLGVVEQDDAAFLYRYDIMAGKPEQAVKLDAANVGPVFQRPADGSFWIVVGSVLNRLDPASLERQPVADLGGGLGFPQWLGDTLLGTRGGEVVKVTLP